MKQLYLYSALLYCLTVSATFAKPHHEEQPLDKMVAIVNDDVISRTELSHAISNAKLQIAQEHLPVPPVTVLQKQVLDQLINKKIQLQIAKQAGVQTTDEELNRAIQHISEQNNMTTAELYERINQDGMSTEEYRGEMRDQMTMQKLQQQEVASKMVVNPQEVSSFMRSRAWQMSGAKEYHLQDVLVPLSDAPTTDEIMKAKDRADALAAKLQQGQPFDQAVAADVTAEPAVQGGDLGWRKLPEIPSAFADYVVKMKPQSVAGPIQTSNGFHVIRLAEQRTLSMQQAAMSKKMIESLLLQQKFEDAVRTWVSKLRSQAFVVINA